MSGEARRPSLFMYHFARLSVMVFLMIWDRFRAYGARKNVPATGGCLIAANHVSFLDPPVIAASLHHRIMRFMARDTLFSSRIGGWFFRSVQCVPIDRTRGDVGALRKSIQILQAGGVMVLFPEGTRSPDGELKPAKAGMGFLISKAAVPVVPAYVEGTFKAFPKGAKFVRPGRVRVYYGPPIAVAEFEQFGHDRDAYEKIGQLVMSRIAALKPTSR